MNAPWLIVFSGVFAYTLLAAGCREDVNIPPASTRVVVLYSPDNEAVLPDSTVTFTWGTTAENADSFKFQITNDSDFVTGVESYGVKNPEFRLDPNGSNDFFYWRVTAFWRSHGDSGLSSTRRFKQM